jgi:iron complex transport system substrate-binding protein
MTTATLLLAAAVAAPIRVATLMPHVTDALLRVGPPVEVVASVRGDMKTPPVPPALDLGSPHAPNFETLATADPALVVGDRALHGALRDRLAGVGAEVLLVDSTSVDATFSGLEEVGRRVHATDAMETQVTEARKELAALRLPAPVPALLLFGTPGSFSVISNRTWIGDLATRLGFVNVGSAVAGREMHPGFVQVSDEVLTALRPDLILLVAHGDPGAIRATFLRKLDGGGPWDGLRAAATRGVHVLPAAAFSVNPGLHMPEAARTLHDLGAP